MKARDLKAETLGWLRFVRRQEIVCTEVGKYSADCWGLSDTRLIEVETKVTLADFRADFKKGKHRAYAETRPNWGRPNLFYFAVPQDLEIPALKLLEERGTEHAVAKYGLLVVTKVDGYLGRQTREVRPAQRLHAEKPLEPARRAALLRQSSEICGLHQALGATQRLLEPVLSEFASRIEKLYVQADKLNEERGVQDGTTGLE